MAGVNYDFNSIAGFIQSSASDIGVRAGNAELVSAEYRNDLYTRMLINFNEEDDPVRNESGPNGVSTNVQKGITGANIYNKAYGFNGATSYVRVEDNSFAFGPETTIEVRMKPESLSGTQTILAKRDSDVLPDNSFSIVLIDGVVSVKYTSGTSRIVKGLGSLTVDEWVHIAVAITSDKNFKFYKNGVLQATESYSSEILFNTAGIEIGGNPSASGDYFTGDIDMIRISSVERGSFNTRSTLYATDYPTLELADAISSTGVSRWSAIDMPETDESYGNAGLQFSVDGGATYLYFNGNAWTAASAGQCNNVDVASEYLWMLPVTSSGLKFKMVFWSDGLQPVYVTNVYVGYEAADVFAGTPSTVTSGNPMIPFSGAMFDSSATGAEVRIAAPIDALVNGETAPPEYASVDIGRYATLLEAVRALRYDGSVPGSYTFYLRIEYGTITIEDSVTVTLAPISGVFTVMEPAVTAVSDPPVRSEGFEYYIEDEAGDVIDSGVASSPLSVDFDETGSYELVITREGSYHATVPFVVQNEDFYSTIFLSKIEAENPIIAPELPPFDVSIEGIDVSPSRRATTLGDSPFIEFFVFDRRTHRAIDLTNYTVIFAGKEDLKDVGTAWARECTVTDAKYGICSVIMQAEDFPNVGQFTATVTIIDKTTGKRLTTKRYQHDVDEAVYDG